MAGKGMDAGKARTDWAKVHANRAQIDMRPWKALRLKMKYEPLECGVACPICSAAIEVRTDSTRFNIGDDVRCSAGCGMTGKICSYTEDPLMIDIDQKSGESRPGGPSHILEPNTEHRTPNTEH